MKFTKKSIEDLETKKYSYFKMDDTLDNFGVTIYPSGKKSFMIRMRFNGKIITHALSKITFSSFTKETVPKERKRATKIIEKYESGIDVKEEKQKEDSSNKTLNECIEDYLPDVKKSTQTGIIKCKKSWNSWLKKPLKNITQDMVLRAYDKRVKVSFHGARLEAAYLRSIWNHYKKALNLGESPTVILNEERKGWSKRTINHRRLDFEQAPGWLTAVNTLQSIRDKALFKLIYFSGLRASEAMNLTWKMINFDNNSLHIPDTKNGTPLDIPLNSHAINIIQSIKAGKYKHKKYVFPQVDKKGNVSEMKYYAKALSNLKKQGVMWSPHDSRRGFINAGGVSGCNSYMVKQLVNHTDSNEAHDVYHHYTLGELRPTTQTIGDYLNNQLYSPNNVVPFKKEA